MKRIVIGLVVAAVIAMVAYAALRPRALAVEMTEATVRDIREYVAEDAKTRLADEYVIDMPVSGTVQRITWEEGDRIEQGEVIAAIDDFYLRKQLRGIEASIAQAWAQIEGVEVAKPKAEDLEAAGVRVEEAEYAAEMARKEKTIGEINFADAKRDYERIKALYEENAVSRAEYDRAERLYRSSEENLERAKIAGKSAQKALEIARLSFKSLKDSVDDNEYLRQVYLAQIESLEAQREMLENDLEKTTIESPVGGFVLQKYVEDSLVLPAGTRLIKIGDASTIEIEVDVLSEEIGPVDEGDPVEITGKALDGATVMGTVKRVYPSGFKKISSLGIEQQRVRTIVGFDNSGLQLRPGVSVDVRIVTAEHKDAVVVPERAAFRNDGKWHVFTVEGGRAVLTPVTIGLKNDQWAEILEGVEQGEKVVAEPKNELEDGARVAALS